MTAHEKHSCQKARALVVSQCSRECSACTVEESGCEVRPRAFHFRQKFEEPKSEVKVSALHDGVGRLLPVHTTVGVTVAFASMAVLATMLRTRAGRRNTHYQNLLGEDDLGEEEFSGSSDSESF